MLVTINYTAIDLNDETHFEAEELDLNDVSRTEIQKNCREWNATATVYGADGSCKLRVTADDFCWY